MGDEIDFKVGDTVRLRVDGSPDMIVEAVEEDGRLSCAWQDGVGNRQSHAFPARSVRMVGSTLTAQVVPGQ